METKKTYLAIDLKSFYASVECIERNLDPLTTNMVIADAARTEKTICLAVSPSLKAYGISGRPRLFEVVQQMKKINAKRLLKAPNQCFISSSYQDSELKKNPALQADYLVAPPRMAYYIEYSTRIYKVYLKYIAPEDMHVYSIDEVFMDISAYLKIYRMTPRELAKTIVLDVLQTTGITAAAGIGTNLYLAKIAMDIVAKHIEPDADGTRIAELNEKSYRRQLWHHRPLTDFWRVGRGYTKKLEAAGLYTMGDIARCSIGATAEYYNEDLLYKLFGVNAELLIDHAWGYEPCTMAEIKAYQPKAHSLVSGQVLSEPYSFEKAELVIKEMADLLALDLVDKGLTTDQLMLTVGYDRSNLADPERRNLYKGEITIDPYGRQVPKHAHGSIRLKNTTSSGLRLTQAAIELYGKIVNQDLLIRRISISANQVVPEQMIAQKINYEQLDLFTDYDQQQKQKAEEEMVLKREKQIQKAVLKIKKKFGKNAVLKGMNLEDGSTAQNRNMQIGGHRA
ncbi:DNA methylase [Clostridiales bacterium COT073_COT-073]|nr:DNA methylase [Clostridiales bacterium COT073_COT-073]